MSTQTVNGNPASSKDKAGGTNTIIVAETFKIQPVDGLTSRAPSAPNAAPDRVFTELGVLQKLVGNFKGIGLNMIFRPAFEDKSVRDNVLKYNVTSETMAFLNQLGDALGYVIRPVDLSRKQPRPCRVGEGKTWGAVEE